MPRNDTIHGAFLRALEAHTCADIARETQMHDATLRTYKGTQRMKATNLGTLARWLVRNGYLDEIPGAPGAALETRLPEDAAAKVGSLLEEIAGIMKASDLPLEARVALYRTSAEAVGRLLDSYEATPPVDEKR